MSLQYLMLVTVIVVGLVCRVCLWLFDTKIKKVIKPVVVFIVILWLVSLFFPWLSSVYVGHP